MIDNSKDNSKEEFKENAIDTLDEAQKYLKKLRHRAKKGTSLPPVMIETKILTCLAFYRETSK